MLNKDNHKLVFLQNYIKSIQFSSRKYKFQELLIQKAIIIHILNFPILGKEEEPKVRNKATKTSNRKQENDDLNQHQTENKKILKNKTKSDQKMENPVHELITSVTTASPPKFSLDIHNQ